jgi:hypothetical protein
LISHILALLVQAVPVAEPSQEQESPVAAEAAVEEAAVAAPADPALPEPLVLPQGERILIAIDAQLGSKISKAGEMFPIRLAQAVTVNGVEVLPAGIVGEGQVVHAKKAGMAGAAGELILAARYLDYGDRRIELRSFKFIEEGDEILSRGTNNVDLASATNVAIGPLGFFIGGGNTTIEPGTIATAKIRNDEAFDVQGAVPEEPAG